MPKRILMAAGGTGGHIIPALNVALALIKEKAEVFYVGNKNSMEYDIIKRNNINFYIINVQKLYRKLTFKHLLFPFRLIISIFMSIKYIKKIKPDAFIGFGGFVAGPVAIAAWMTKCPIYIQEQNCKPGITNLWTGKIAYKVFLAYKESEKYFKKNNNIITGNPVNIDITDIKQKSKNDKTILILGGSQGSLFINNLILENIDWFEQNRYKLIWQTGKNHLQRIKPLVTNNTCIEVLFDFTDQINNYYQKADYVISRGGALTLSEIEIYKIPSFIIPLSTAAVNEQYFNAKNIENRNMGMLFEEKDKNLFKDRFLEFVNRSKDMFKEEYTSLHLNATENIVKILLEAK